MKSLRYSTQTISKKDIASVSSVLKSDFLTTGPKTIEFENKIIKFSKVESKKGANYNSIVAIFTIEDKNKRVINFFLKSEFIINQI